MIPERIIFVSRGITVLYLPPGLTFKILHGDDIAFMCFVWLSEQTVTFAIYIINRLVFITEVESVYSAVRTESLHNTNKSRNLKVNFAKP